MEGGRNGRTLKSSPVLTRKFSVVHSSNLLHRPKEDNAGAAATAPKTLANVLALDRKRGLAPSPSGSSRSLLDIIRHENTNNADYAGATQSVDWRTFKDRLILQRATTAFSSTSSSFSSSSSYHRHHPAQAPDLAPTIPTTSTADGTLEAGEPVRVSLMTLLEQTDRMGGLRISGDLPEPAAKVVSPVKAEEEDDDDDDGEMVHVCGVCMVRHKGAAFIPCGHTFCRLCSRELWVSRGNCPLCNGYILEILDIF